MNSRAARSSPLGRVRTAFDRPEARLVGTFAGLIIIGAALLSLPIAHAAEPVGVLDAAFTSTSAVCVTGLVSVDTPTRWSRFGQVVILVLIQLGGLGVMTFAVVMVQLVQTRISLGAHAALSDVFFQDQARGELRRSLRRVVGMTLLIEGVGAAVLYAGLRSAAQPGDAFEAVFLSVSAFCNAGFALRSDSLIGQRDAALIIWPVMILITLGGLGYTVLFEAARRFRHAVTGRGRPAVNWSLNSRIVLYVSAGLTFGGAAALVACGLTPTEVDWWPTLLHALFQSVTARTAGFNSVDIAALPVASLLLLVALMFVGGSPGSCAGGVKTTTATVWAAGFRAWTRGRDDVTVLGRRVPTDVVRRAGVVVAVAVSWNLVGVLLLAASERVGAGGPPLEHVVFEQFSAFGTVGLSTGITFNLSDIAKIWLILTMFIGRLGPLTIALLVLTGAPPSRYRLPQERVMIG